MLARAAGAGSEEHTKLPVLLFYEINIIRASRQLEVRVVITRVVYLGHRARHVVFHFLDHEERNVEGTIEVVGRIASVDATKFAEAMARTVNCVLIGAPECESL